MLLGGICIICTTLGRFHGLDLCDEDPVYFVLHLNFFEIGRLRSNTCVTADRDVSVVDTAAIEGLVSHLQGNATTSTVWTPCCT